MSGHSKWHSIKHKKGAADAARGKLFARLCREIEVAARTGGGDPDSNATLQTKIQKARDASVPKDNIENAVKRGTGELEGVQYEQLNYEGYAPNGVAVLVECLSDNRNRTGSEIKNIFSRNGGSLAEPGAVAWQFERKGVILIDGDGVDEEALMDAALEAVNESRYGLHASVFTRSLATAFRAIRKSQTRKVEAPSPSSGRARSSKAGSAASAERKVRSVASSAAWWSRSS